MIVQFPTPYPDELLYSVFGRYHMRSGNYFWKHTLEDLFGRRTATASVFLPAGIRSFVGQLPQNTTLDEKLLIEKHTLYPFFTAFLPPDRAQAIYHSMLSDDGGKIYMQSGLMASSIPQNKNFKYCPMCFREDLDKYGELYWHRIHQLPGKLICMRHGIWLEDSTVPLKHENKHVYILPTAINCDLKKENHVNTDLLSFYKQFLKQIESLINESFNRKPYLYYTKSYKKILVEKGYANPNGQMYQNKLHKYFFGFYPEEFLKNLNIDMGKCSWLASLTRKHRKSFHPYYHILLLNLLNTDIKDLFEEESVEFEPFGKPCWPCLNVTCSDYKRAVIPAISMRVCEKTKKPIGRFTCPTCGFSYTRKGIDNNQNDRYQYSRIMNFGYLWEKEFKTFVHTGISNRQIANQLNVDPKTVAKYKKVLSGEVVESSNQNSKKEDELIRNRREEWLKMQEDYPDFSKTQLRKLKPSVYTYLYRHDQEWLNQNSPKLQKKYKNCRVDWEIRDRDILKEAKRAVEKLRSYKSHPRRITLKSIGDTIGQRDLLEQHLDKMPKTKTFIEQVQETEREYRIRRVRIVIEEMKESGEEIKEWKVLRRAGIKEVYKNEIREIIGII